MYLKTDPPLRDLEYRLLGYKQAGTRQTVGHLRRLVQGVNLMRNSRTGNRRNVGECYASLGGGIASGSVSRYTPLLLLRGVQSATYSNTLDFP